MKSITITQVREIKKNGILCHYYERLIGRGMLKMKALIAVVRKLLGIIHALVRDDTDYVGEHQAPERRLLKKAA